MSAKQNTLLVDCGNTYLKWCLFDGENLTEQQSLYHAETSELEAFQDLIDNQTSTCDSVVMVSVLGEIFSSGAKLLAEGSGLSFLDVKSQAHLGNITNAYSEPEKLGSDRLVAMIGAYDLIEDLIEGQGNEACIVIDSGTATTIDAVDETGQHQGGVIFPGFALSLKSLSKNTHLLPNLDAEEQEIEKNGFAKSTPEAIASGCLLSLASAIDGICNKMQRQLESAYSKGPNGEQIVVKRIICGGAAKALLPHLENDYDYRDNLIMLGLKKVKGTIAK